MTDGNKIRTTPRNEFERQYLPKEFVKSLKPLKNKLACELTGKEAQDKFEQLWASVNGIEQEGIAKWVAHAHLADMEMQRQIQFSNFDDARKTYEGGLSSLAQLEKDANGNDIIFPQTLLTKARLVRTAGLVELFDGEFDTAREKFGIADELFTADEIVTAESSWGEQIKSARHSKINKLYAVCVDLLEYPDSINEDELASLIEFAISDTEKISVLDRLPIWQVLLDDRVVDRLTDEQLLAINNLLNPVSTKQKLGRGATSLLSLPLRVGINTAGAAVRKLRD